MAVPFTKAGVIVVVVGHTPCINGKSTYVCMWLIKAFNILIQ